MFRPGFRFSQSSLQDYVDCPRRFQLRYVLGSEWPGVWAEPFLEVERSVDLGARFHRLVGRHQSGVPAERIEELVSDEIELLGWWRAYESFEFLHGLDGSRYSEFELDVAVGEWRLAARFDLLVVGDSGVYVFDWKTSRVVVGASELGLRLQSRVYLYVLAMSLERVFGGGCLLDGLSLVYWFARYGRAVSVGYSSEECVEDGLELRRLIDGVCDRLVGGEWPLAEDVRLCRLCVFRSYCGRGVVAGDGFTETSNGVANIAGGDVFGFGGGFGGF